VNPNWPVAIKSTTPKSIYPVSDRSNPTQLSGDRKRERLDIVESVRGVPGGPGYVERENTKQAPGFAYIRRYGPTQAQPFIRPHVPLWAGSGRSCSH
jgi:hypothetical protein